MFAAVLGLQRSNSTIPFVAGALAIASVVLFLLAGAIVAVVYWPTDFDRPPRPSALRDEFLMVDPRETKLSVIDTIIDAYNRNAAVIKRKAFAFKVAFLLTGGATGFLGAAVTGQIAFQTTPWQP